ncbi:MAG TPA: hypothetical protein VFV67_02155 [Actinophytocola sp.]|uniref:hypothetical protein n=1 Tax=Actinophytocola sp. TaxID=1872138 RepID=UPI002DBAE013|nr:hypothetical protein [Actinophytocola sp.]HEU5469428.1 hypothetical protein [Actinophytocola sp.]
MTAPAPGYPPGPPTQYQQYPPQQYQYPQQPRPPRRPRWTGGLLGGILLLIATGITVWGSFGVVQTFTRDRGEDLVFEVQETWWTARQGRPTADEESVLFGLPLILAAALLLMAGLFALSAITSRRSGLVTSARVFGGTGLGLLAGALLLQVLEGLELLNQANNANPEPGENVRYEMGLGIWLPMAALLIGLIGLTLALTGTAGRAEPDTPPMGWRALQPAGYPPGQPVAFPASQPIQQPMSGPASVQQPMSGPVPVQQPVTGPTSVQPATGPTPVPPPAAPPVTESPAQPPATPSAAAEPAAEQQPPPDAEPAEHPAADETQRTGHPDDNSRN